MEKAQSSFSILSGEQGLVTGDLPLITHPEYFSTLLSNLPKDKLPVFFEEMNKVLDTYELNAVQLINSTPDPLISLISFTFTIVDNPPLLKFVLQFFKRLLKVGTLSVEHYEFIYQKASSISATIKSREKSNEHYKLFYICAKLLKMIAKHDPPNLEKPSTYFYFFPFNSRIKLDLPTNTIFPFSSVNFLILIIRDLHLLHG